MSMQGEGKDAKGRNYDQITKDGTSSAGSMGTGGTGDIGKTGAGVQPGSGQGSQQSGAAGRTDDLLAGNTADQEADQGFAAESGKELQTGLEGIGNRTGSGAGNRQSGKEDGGG